MCPKTLGLQGQQNTNSVVFGSVCLVVMPHNINTVSYIFFHVILPYHVYFHVILQN